VGSEGKCTIGRNMERRPRGDAYNGGLGGKDSRDFVKSKYIDRRTGGYEGSRENRGSSTAASRESKRMGLKAMMAIEIYLKPKNSHSYSVFPSKGASNKSL